MARITIEDCIKQVDNPFVLVHMVTKRVKQLKGGSDPLVKCDNREVVTALREIAAGKITPVRNDDEAESTKKESKS